MLEALDGEAPDVTVEVESLAYIHEPGFAGPTVAYPAREGDS